jgi:hypothetical protein
MKYTGMIRARAAPVKSGKIAASKTPKNIRD